MISLETKKTHLGAESSGIRDNCRFLHVALMGYEVIWGRTVLGERSLASSDTLDVTVQALPEKLLFSIKILAFFYSELMVALV